MKRERHRRGLADGALNRNTHERGIVCPGNVQSEHLPREHVDDGAQLHERALVRYERKIARPDHVGRNRTEPAQDVGMGKRLSPLVLAFSWGLRAPCRLETKLAHDTGCPLRVNLERKRYTWRPVPGIPLHHQLYPATKRIISFRKLMAVVQTRSADAKLPSQL